MCLLNKLNKPKHKIGILAYGSLINNAGHEINKVKIDEVKAQTPFGVEFARQSDSRNGAPTLIPYAGGACVHAKILVLAKDTPLDLAYDALYRREIDQVGNLAKQYDKTRNRQNIDTGKLLIETLQNLSGVELVLYTFFNSNISEFQNITMTKKAKAMCLAKLAFNSVTPKTYGPGQDGIQYLSDALAHGIVTPLTDEYKSAILEMVGGAPSLDDARIAVAVSKGIISR